MVRATVRTPALAAAALLAALLLAAPVVAQPPASASAAAPARTHAAAAVTARPAAAASSELASAKRMQPSRLWVRRNTIIRDGRPFRFYGVNRDSLVWGRSNWGGCGGDGHFAGRDFDLIRSWRATAVRIPLSQAAWLGRSCPAADYARRVDEAVARANERGMYVILELHWSDVRGRAPCGRRCRAGQQPMPDLDSIVFWRRIARRYRDTPGVIFGLHNEPHGVPWGCWRDGGCTVWSHAATDRRVRYHAVGMQQLYDTVRAQGANNLVLAGGLDYAYDLSGVGAGYALRGRNIAYDTHVYTMFHTTVPDWDQHFGYLTDRYPVVATEFGSSDCSPAVPEQLLRYFRAPLGKPRNRMSWTIWSWNNPGNCSQPSVIADWDGTPMPGQGELIKQALATDAR